MQNLQIGKVRRLQKPEKFSRSRLPLVLSEKRKPSLRPLQRVLVVEDDPLMVASLTSLLSFERVTATAVHRGVHALAAIASVRPDLAIVDIGLPDYDGREICRAIVEQFSIPVVLTSGRFSQIERSNDGPFVHFLQKPFSMSDLRAAIAPLGFEIREQRKRRRRRPVAVSVV